MTIDLATLSVTQLLDLNNRISQELLQRKVIRGGNIVAEYCEWLAASALNLSLANVIQKGYDATDAEGNRYQVKGRKKFNGQARRINGSGSLSSESFDYLVIVLLNADFTVYRACVAPVNVIILWPIKYESKSWSFRATDNLLRYPGVLDVTDLFRDTTLMY